MKKITVVTGHYGSGKTNLSVNLAADASNEGKSVAVVDLDLVNPYFRTADFKDYFESIGVKLIAPDFANSNLDVPSIQFDIEQLAMNEDCL
ncbi:MAG: cobalamin biosynthesis protein CobQ, partial [Ruminococcus sp.]|nr:cobalamin biosynthesis protein CobQ [Ruminococcus sp.]